MSVERVGCRDIMKELFRTASWSCTFPYNLSKEGFEVSLVRSCIGVGLPFGLSYMSLRFPSWSVTDFNDQPLLQIMDFFAVFFSISLQITLVPWLLLNAKSLNAIADDLNTFDVCLLADGISWKFTVRYYEDLMCLILVLSPSLMTLLLEDHSLSRIVTECLHSAIPFFTFSVVLYFRRFILVLSSAFETLGKHTASSSSDTKPIDAALLNFDKLYACSSRLAEVFALHLFLMLAWSFFSGVIGFYLTHKSITEKAEFYEIVKLLAVSLTFFSVFFLLVSPCAIIRREVKGFNTLLYQLLIDDKSTGIANNKKLRLHFAMKREVTLTACGFFTLDYTLVHSMIAGATTYLVILIQFGQPPANIQQ